MDAFAATLGRPQAGGKAEDYTVLTSLTTDEEAEFVSEASGAAGGITGLEPWLEFFLLEAVEIFPTTFDLPAQLQTADQGNVKYLVSDIRDFDLDNGQAATRYTVELDSDYGHFVYDRVFVAAEVNDCSDCKGFIVQTAIAGRTSATPPGTVEPPPAAYPQQEFEETARSAKLHSTSAHIGHVSKSSSLPIRDEGLATFETAGGGNCAMVAAAE
ncbi:MAG: hypothetical protein Q7T33_07785 [Dehalococcoidia bacterium]|nr:hypothetical protein [Dehalococcoidia bacterium]